MGFFQKVRTWFQGKKMILGGIVIVSAAFAGVALGQLEPVYGLALAGYGFKVCGEAAKANRHQAELLSALQAVATAGVDLRAGDREGAEDALAPVVAGAIQDAAARLAPGNLVSGDVPVAEVSGK